MGKTVSKVYNLCCKYWISDAFAFLISLKGTQEYLVFTTDSITLKTSRKY